MTTETTPRFFATLDADGERIPERAGIDVFESREAAEAWLRDANADFLRESEAAGEPLRLTVEPGEFSDCWIKTYDEPTAERLDLRCEPFTPDELIVKNPGQHPGGGRQWWITPRPEVLVAIIEPA